MNWIGGVGIRPECVRVLRADEKPDLRRGKLVDSTFLGAYTQVGIHLEGGERISAHLPGDLPCSPGESVCVEWNSQDEMRFPG